LAQRCSMGAIRFNPEFKTAGALENDFPDHVPQLWW
jgi:hypothetical protein